MPQMPGRLSNVNKSLDCILGELGPDGLAIELERRGLGNFFRRSVVENCLMEQVLWEFQESIRLSTVGPETKKTYDSELQQFQRYIQAEDLLEKEADKVLVDKVYGNYLAKKMSTNTRNKKVALLRNLHNFCKRNNWVDTPVPGVLKTEAVSPSVPRALSPEAVQELMELAKTTRYAHRYHCLISVMLATGCRIGEVATLRISDVDFPRCQARVFGKNHPEGRTVYLGESVTELLKE